MSDLLALVIGPERVAAMLEDPAMFAEIFDKKPWDYQTEDMRAIVERDEDEKYLHRFAVVSMPRQDGKTTECAWLALCLALCDPDVSSVLCVALDRDGARILLTDVRRIIMGSDILMSLVDGTYGLSKNTVRFIDGTELFVKSADAQMSRGLRPSVVIYDEAGWDQSDGALFQVTSAAQAAQVNPLFILASTVGPIQYGILWNFFERARQDDPTVLLIYRNENLSPLVSKDYLEGQRHMLPPSVFAREHENLWSSGTDAFCTVESWEQCARGGSPLLKKFPGPSYMYIDLGIIADETAIAVTARGENQVEVIALDAMRGKKGRPLAFDRIKRRVHQMVERLGVTQIKIESPQGYAMAQELAHELRHVSVKIVHPTKQVQNDLWGYFHGALRDGTIHIPTDTLLRRQLLSLTIKQTTSGWKVVDVPSLHQDRCIAVGGAGLMASGDGMGMFEWLDLEREEAVELAKNLELKLKPEPEPARKPVVTWEGS